MNLFCSHCSLPSWYLPTPHAIYQSNFFLPLLLLQTTTARCEIKKSALEGEFNLWTERKQHWARTRQANCLRDVTALVFNVELKEGKARLVLGGCFPLFFPRNIRAALWKNLFSPRIERWKTFSLARKRSRPDVMNMSIEREERANRDVGSDLIFIFSCKKLFGLR